MNNRLLLTIAMLLFIQQATGKKQANRAKSEPSTADIMDEMSGIQYEELTKVFRKIKDSGLLKGGDEKMFASFLEFAKMNYEHYEEKTQQLEETQIRYQEKLQEMQDLHEQMSNTEALMNMERENIQQIQEQHSTLVTQLNNCLSNGKDIDKERKGWEETTSRFAIDLKLADDLIQEEKKKVKHCLQEAKNKDKLLEEFQTKLESFYVGKNKTEESPSVDFDEERQNYVTIIEELNEKLDASTSPEAADDDAVLKRKNEYIKFLKKENIRLASAMNNKEKQLQATIKHLTDENLKLQRVGPDANLVADLQQELQKIKGADEACKLTKELLEERYAELKEINSGTARSVTHWNVKYVQCKKNVTQLTNYAQNTQNRLKESLQTQDHMRTFYWNNLKNNVPKEEENCMKFRDEMQKAQREKEELEEMLETERQKFEVKLKKVIDERDTARNKETQIRTVCKTSLTKKIDELSELQSEYDDLKEKYYEAQNKTAQAVDEQKSSSIEIEEGLKSLRKLKKENKKLSKKLAMCKEESLDCRTQKTIFEKKLEVSQKSLNERDKMLKALNKDCAELSSCLYELEHLTTHYDASLEQCQCQAIEEKDENGETQIIGFKSLVECNREKNGNSLKETLENCDSTVVFLRESLQHSKTEISHLNSVVEEMVTERKEGARQRQECENMREKFEQMQSTLPIVMQEKDEKISRQGQQIEHLRQMLGERENYSFGEKWSIISLAIVTVSAVLYYCWFRQNTLQVSQVDKSTKRPAKSSKNVSKISKKKHQ